MEDFETPKAGGDTVELTEEVGGEFAFWMFVTVVETETTVPKLNFGTSDLGFSATVVLKLLLNSLEDIGVVDTRLGCELGRLNVTCFVELVLLSFESETVGANAEVAIGDVFTFVVDVVEFREAKLAGVATGAAGSLPPSAWMITSGLIFLAAEKLKETLKER